MSRFITARICLFAGGAPLVLPTTSQAQFVHNTADVPPSSRATENVDFGDLDGDGDWDAVFANGGDSGNQQSVVWINGGPGAGLGTFTNETSTRFPAATHTSRDVELADIDGDADLDLYLANTAQIVVQSSRWWVNLGGPDGGTPGFYQDQTAARWSGLGAAGSSIPLSQVLGSGGFIDFSCDCDFGDLDNDGDLDLVHSSYGGAFGGNVPTRLFLNDGQGVFREFNPSGFQLPGQNIANGSPGLWAAGTQSANTTDSTGAFCDIASSALDVDLHDVDGDFDLDLMHGARDEHPRMFQNRLAQSAGVLAPFRDVTGSTYPPGHATGNGHYEQEFGDFDGDGDIDVYGLNWQAGVSFYDDVVLRNDGAGVFHGLATVPSSLLDDNEADFVDYDLDGDLDVFVAAFSGGDRLYENSGLASGVFVPTSGLVPVTAGISLDADACDVDSDGDYDVFVAKDVNQPEAYLQNTTSADDVFAPVIPHVEQAANRSASAVPTVVRAHVYDNAPYYINWYDTTWVSVTVDGGAPVSYPATSSQGQVFRCEIPGGWIGTIAYQFVSSDEYGNTGTSAVLAYVATSNAVGTSYCFGDGSGTPCPCANPGAAERGCANSLFAQGALLQASGVASLSSDSVLLLGSEMPNSSALYFQGDAQVGGGLGSLFGDGLRCAGGATIRLGTTTNVAGASQYPGAGDPTVSVRGAITSPGVRTYQVWYRNAAAFCTSATFNLTNGLSVTWST